jgi:hypothetical protein
MNIQQGFTFKQHLKYFALSLLVSGICFYLDVKNDTLIPKSSIQSSAITTNSETFFQPHYEVAHSALASIEIQ